MALSYREKMRLSEGLLEGLRLRLTGKSARVLPPEGQTYSVDPAEISLVGGLAPRPDPDYHREQPPSAMGMVLMVDPDQAGKVELTLCGRFDVVHRVIPTHDSMRREIQVNSTGEKTQQKLLDCFKRFTVEFQGVRCLLDVAHLNEWSEHSLKDVLNGRREAWKEDLRIFRACNVNDRGYASLTIPWTEGDFISEDDFVEQVSSALFVGEDVLEHDVILRARLRSPPPTFDNPGTRCLLEVYLQNNTEVAVGRSFGLMRPSLLDVEFEVRLESGTQNDVPHRLAPEDYRYQPEDGVAGYGVTCAVEKLGKVCKTSGGPLLPETA